MDGPLITLDLGVIIKLILELRLMKYFIANSKYFTFQIHGNVNNGESHQNDGDIKENIHNGDTKVGNDTVHDAVATEEEDCNCTLADKDNSDNSQINSVHKSDSSDSIDRKLNTNHAPIKANSEVQSGTDHELQNNDKDDHSLNDSMNQSTEATTDKNFEAKNAHDHINGKGSKDTNEISNKAPNEHASGEIDKEDAQINESVINSNIKEDESDEEGISSGESSSRNNEYEVQGGNFKEQQSSDNMPNNDKVNVINEGVTNSNMKIDENYEEDISSGESSSRNNEYEVQGGNFIEQQNSNTGHNTNTEKKDKTIDHQNSDNDEAGKTYDKNEANEENRNNINSKEEKAEHEDNNNEEGTHFDTTNTDVEEGNDINADEERNQNRHGDNAMTEIKDKSEQEDDGLREYDEIFNAIRNYFN